MKKKNGWKKKAEFGMNMTGQYQPNKFQDPNIQQPYYNVGDQMAQQQYMQQPMQPTQPIVADEDDNLQQPTQPKQSSGKGFTTPGTGDLIAGGIQLANSLLPEHQTMRRKQHYGTYDENAYGTGSQAIYASGGDIKPLWNSSGALKDKDFLNWYNNNTPEGRNKIPYKGNTDYDYYSFYKNGESYNGGHFPDTYKLPNHQTFSNESLYSTPEYPGGSWNGEQYNPIGTYQYADGGSIMPVEVKKRQVGGFKVTEEIPTNLGYGMQNQPVVAPAPIPQPFPIPHQTPSITFNKLTSADGSGTTYEPVPSGGWNPNDWQNAVKSLPDNYGGFPVLKGQPLNQAWNIPHNSDSVFWRANEGTQPSRTLVDITSNMGANTPMQYSNPFLPQFHKGGTLPGEVRDVTPAPVGAANMAVALAVEQAKKTGAWSKKKNGGDIHIKESHKGKFTEYKKRTGKTTEEALHSKDPNVRKMAQFAKNASKWSKKADGGTLQYKVGDELDLDPQTISALISQGYTFEF